MSLSWTPFLNEFFSCLLLALLFVDILLHVFLPCCWEMLFSPAVVSAQRSFNTIVLDQHPSRHSVISSFFALSSTIPLSSIDLLASCHFLRHHPIWPCFAQTVGLQLELCSLHGVAAPPHALPRAAATSPRAPHTLCLQSSSALGRHSLSKQQQHCLSHTRRLFRFFCSFSSTLW